MRPLCFLLLAVVSLSVQAKSSSPPRDGGSCTLTTYDEYFKGAAKMYLGSESLYVFLKAQACQESNLDPGAVSHVGAQGIGQIMPATWRELLRDTGTKEGSPFDPKLNIYLQAYYLRRQIDGWPWGRPIEEKLYLGLASYNAGRGNIHKAQRLCLKERLRSECINWIDIKEYLPQVTGHHSKETITYVHRISNLIVRLGLQGYG